jgi:hypothetical protein
MMQADTVEAARIDRNRQLSLSTSVSKAKKAKVSLAKVSWGA